MSEPDGVVTLRVRLLEGSISAGINILVRLTTADGFSISAGFDYEPLSINLTFNSMIMRIDLNVTILDDSIVEMTEQFEARLTAVTTGPNIILSPRIARIFILEDAQDSTLILKHR